MAVFRALCVLLLIAGPALAGATVRDADGRRVRVIENEFGRPTVRGPDGRRLGTVRPLPSDRQVVRDADGRLLGTLDPALEVPRPGPRERVIR